MPLSSAPFATIIFLYEYPFGRDVEETDLWTNTKFNYEGLLYVVKLQRKENNIRYNFFQNTTNYKTSEVIQEI